MARDRAFPDSEGVGREVQFRLLAGCFSDLMKGCFEQTVIVRLHVG